MTFNPNYTHLKETKEYNTSSAYHIYTSLIHIILYRQTMLVKFMLPSRANTANRYSYILY